MAARVASHTAPFRLLPEALLQVHGLLSERGPMTEAEIGSVLGLMPNATHDRVRRLVERGAIASAGLGSIEGVGIRPTRWQALRITAAPKGARRRPCLNCGRSFRSEGIHNRLCGGCGETARGLSRQFQEAS